ncbi:hypothetical protein D6774_02715 [Candidatus Woesearchaeota archaeon]|nr:MAG: hypothetical protein D6774_02715 [Candidatus Woesearchaeota archaeon]
MEFHKPYYSPLDEGFHEAKPLYSKPTLEQPIFSAKEIGTTVPESIGGQGNFIQNIESQIRMGTGTMQLVLTTSHMQQLMGRMKAYGKEAREQMRELAQAAGVTISGIEMPTSSMTNLSGFDQRSGAVSEQLRRSSMDEAKEAIRFIGEVGGGGGVDIWSQEFARSINEANYESDVVFKGHEPEEQQSIGLVVDTETGKIVADLNKSTQVPRLKYRRDAQGYFIDENGNRITDFHDFDKRAVEVDEQGNYQTEVVTWREVQEEAQKWNQLTGQDLRPEEFFVREQVASQLTQGRAQRLQMEDQLDEINRIVENLKQNLPPQEAESKIRYYEQRKKELAEAVALSKQQEELQKQKLDKYESLHRYAKEKSIEGYAELGIEALKTQKQLADKITHDLYVGPELGWPTAWGGHPREFTELIKGAREKMAKKLQEEGYKEKEARELAKKHIKGCFDTSHLAMWFDYMDWKSLGLENAPHEKKLEAFNKWFMKEVDYMAKEGVIGSVQAVDSMSGAHSHLPPGQGVFPVVDAVVHLKKQGWEGPIVSEGHEEEGLTKGRIQLEAWRAFGADVGGGLGYHRHSGTQPELWTDVAGSYFGRTNPPNYIFGNYAPDPQEWVFWSGVPLE